MKQSSRKVQKKPRPLDVTCRKSKTCDKILTAEGYKRLMLKEKGIKKS